MELRNRKVCGKHFKTWQYKNPTSKFLNLGAIPRTPAPSNTQNKNTKDNFEFQIEDEIIATGKDTEPLLCNNKVLLKTKSTYSKFKHEITFKENDQPPQKNNTKKNNKIPILDKFNDLSTNQFVQDDSLFDKSSSDSFNVANERIINSPKVTTNQQKKRKCEENEMEIVDDKKYDDQLYKILNEVNSLPTFLDVIFGFLYRRTNYYETSTDPNEEVGLPEDATKELLWQTFKKYKNKHKRKQTRKDDSGPVIEEPVKPSKTTEENNPYIFQTCNGSVFDNYAWSQSIRDVDIQIKIPHKVTCNQLQIDIGSSNLQIKLKDSETVYLSGELCKQCKVIETVWSLGGYILQIHLEKKIKSWWDCLLKTEPKLDLNKMKLLRQCNIFFGKRWESDNYQLPIS